MEKNPLQARFITLEGGEGSGKSTQVKKIKAWLESNGVSVCLTREPGGSPQAEEIRKLLVEGETGRWDGVSEYLLLSAARRQHLLQTIWPALARGDWVICDRFQDSSVAYQGYGHGVSLPFLDEVYHHIAGDFQPHLTLVMGIEAKEGLSRTKGRDHGSEDRYERMEYAFHERLAKGYEDLAKKNPDRCVRVDASQGVEEVFESIKAILEKRFGF
ncbi:MAG: dTMP kinase [bacterium]|nr:dTMP kinase [bacterium]